MPLISSPRAALCHLAWLSALGCGSEASVHEPAGAASADLGAARPLPAADTPELPPPPRDPWAAEGLSALRNGDDLGWPVESVHVTSAFGWRLDPVAGIGTRMHKGTDFRGDVGDLVLSVARGDVTFAGHDPVLGTMVVVDHGLGITSLYGHMSDVLVWPGASIDRGTALGLVGNTGRSAAPHLHLTMKIDDVAVDPMMLLGQPLHRATALRGVAPRTHAPALEMQAAPQDPQAAPVLQP
ncbi:MAG: M23 family metallopeptidase [Nannocystaceae bacterium]|nr:M23 family metallopeptidase [Nannocystaceae bacterium]